MSQLGSCSFIDWLKGYNENLSSNKRVGFYSLDVYSFSESMQSVVQYLEKNDPEALAVTKKSNGML